MGVGLVVVVVVGGGCSAHSKEQKMLKKRTYSKNSSNLDRSTDEFDLKLLKFYLSFQKVVQRWKAPKNGPTEKVEQY